MMQYVRLRERKQREAKPFAVMFRDLSELKKYCYVEQMRGIRNKIMAKADPYS